tara:strand:- start:2687 stop:2884 length:198 start_codon:yes stop_codon:yes gene_type:complete
MLLRFDSENPEVSEKSQEHLQNGKVQPRGGFFQRFKVDGIVVIQLGHNQRSQCSREHYSQPKVEK